MRKSTVVLWTILITFPSAFSSGFYNERGSRSFKDSFKKGTFPAKVINGLQREVSSLESSMNRVQHEVEVMEDATNQIEKSVNEEKTMLEKLDEDFKSLERTLSTHTNMLSELRQIVQPDEKTFSFSNETCGGILQAQSGYASYTSSFGYKGQLRTLRKLRSAFLPAWLASSCVWVIQANHRSTIKLTADVLELPYFNNDDGYPNGAFVLNGVSDGTTPRLFQQPRVVKLQMSVTYTFQGPLLFVVLLFPRNAPVNALSPFSLRFHYDSDGQRRMTNTLFMHQSVDINSGLMKRTISENDFDMPALLRNSSTTTTTVFTSFILSNFTTRLRLRTEWDPEKCSDKVFFASIAVTDLLFNRTGNNSGQVTNLCNLSNSERNNLLTSYGIPVMVFIVKPKGQPFPFNMSWNSDPQYRSVFVDSGTLYSSTSNRTCGDVLGGTSGQISYKPNGFYRNGERCVWVIAPQPAPRASGIEIYFQQIQTASHNSEEAMKYDPVYLMELTTIDGNERPDGPKITMLNNTIVNYKAMSKEVYLVFYSDFSSTNYGFQVKWNAYGSYIEDNGLNISSTEYSFASSNTGTVTLRKEDSRFFSSLYQVFIFVPSLPSTWHSTPNYVFGMNFQLNYTGAIDGGSGESTNCIQEEFYIFTPVNNGIMEQRQIDCLSPGKATIKNADGMMLMIWKNSGKSRVKSNVTLNFAWHQEFPENDTRLVKLENDKCGGVMIGERGVLRYKLDQTYNPNEHCIWLLNAPNSSSVTVKVLKQRFSTTDHLVLNTIDTNTGTLKNESTELLGYENYTLNDSLVVISFRPSGENSLRKGFILQFWSTYESKNETFSNSEDSVTNEEYIEFRLRHSETRFARFLFDEANQTSKLGIKQLHIMAYSAATIANVAAKPAPITINWTMGIFKKNRDSCIFDSIAFYTTVDLTWLKNVEFPQDNDTTVCPNQVKVANRPNLFKAENGAFLMVYKLIPFPVEDDSKGDERRIDFIHRSEIGNSSSHVKAPEKTEADTSLESFHSRSYLERVRYIERMLSRYHRHYPYSLSRASE